MPFERVKLEGDPNDTACPDAPYRYPFLGVIGWGNTRGGGASSGAPSWAAPAPRRVSPARAAQRGQAPSRRAPSVQDEEPSGEVALLAGGALHDKELVGGTDPQAELGPVLGLRGGYRLSDRYRLVADATASRFDTALPDGASVLALRFGFEVFPRSARWGRWSPFSSFGFGWLKAEDTPPGDLSRPLVTAGFGQRRAGGGGNAWLWTARLDRTLGDADLPGRQISFVQVLLGRAWGVGPAPGDEDSDRVLDRGDACPGTPQGATVDGRGCPSDGDHDGVLDGLDRCPDTPGGWPVDPGGCPTDQDGDRVADGTDACPDTPAGATVDARGCPSDQDSDRVFDGLDRCPDTPARAIMPAYPAACCQSVGSTLDGFASCQSPTRSINESTSAGPTLGAGDAARAGAAMPAATANSATRGHCLDWRMARDLSTATRSRNDHVSLTSRPFAFRGRGGASGP